MMRKVTAEQAFADYLAMQPRSLIKLFQRYAETVPDGPPLATLKYWSKKHEWQQKIAEHEAQVEHQLRGKAAKAQANERWNAAQDLHKVAELGTKRLIDKIANIELKSGADAKAMADAVVTLIGKADVLEGGVSNRTEEIVEPEYRGLGKFRRKAEEAREAKEGDDER